MKEKGDVEGRQKMGEKRREMGYVNRKRRK